ncbi:MAG: hypothetical protein IJ816_01775 [Alloprevotella sp.]|nr:hypothetical protein [Alloprevotella sp.]
MKSIFSKTLMLGALFFLSIGAANSQTDKGYTPFAMNADVKALADQIIDVQFSDPEKGNKLYQTLSRKIKKNNEQLIAVGDYFLDKKIISLANFCARQVYQNDATYIPGLFFGAEVAFARRDYGTAGQKYEEILNIQPENTLAMELNAFVYKNVNPHVSIEMYNKIKELNPSNYNVDKELADVYYNMNEFEDAAKFYEQYFNNVPKGKENEGAAENFVSSLHMNHNIEALSANAKKFSALFPKSPVFKRMIFFADVENYDVEAAEQSAAYLNDASYVDTVFTYLDYEYAAQYASDMKNDAALAAEYMEKAIKKDPAKIEGLSKLANYKRNNGQHDEAIATFKSYIEKKGKEAAMADTFKLALFNLYASQAAGVSAEKKAEYVKEGDQLFQLVEAAQPDNYQPTYYRAVINTTDDFSEEVRQLYENVLVKLGDDTENETVRLRADWYNVVYYINTGGENKAVLANARKYVNDMLSVDDENDSALNADKYLKNFGL